MSNLTNFEFVTLDITRKNYLYWTLNVEIHLDATGLGDTIKKRNKASEPINLLLRQQYCEKKFHKYSEFISCLCMAEQSNELLIESHETCRIGSAPFLEVNLIYILMIMILIMDMVIKEISKTHFVTKSGTIM